MIDDLPTFFVQTSCRQTGALGIVHLHGDEVLLAKKLDAELRTKRGRKNKTALDNAELRHGWLWNDLSEAVDEVLLAKPGCGFRILTCHGGAGVMAAVAQHLKSVGFIESRDIDSPPPPIRDPDAVWDPLLAACLTESQAAAVLAAREAGMHRLDDPRFATLLRTREIVLTGPPNAGKSSLLNRLCGHDRAFVHHEAGATRDVVTEIVDLAGFAVRISDMPGFANDLAGLDKEAWQKAAAVLDNADAVLFVIDAANGWNDATDAAAATIAALCRSGAAESPPPILVLANKSDMPNRLDGRPWRAHFPKAPRLSVCSLPGGDARDRVEAAVFALFHGKPLA